MQRRSDYLRYRRDKGKQRGNWLPFLIGLPLICGLLYGIYRLPPVYDALSWRIDDWRTRVIYAINPPDEAVFVPQENTIAQALNATLTAEADPSSPAAVATPIPTASATLAPGETPQPTQPPTITPTLLPNGVTLDGVTYVDQHGRWNYCGPANLTMALKFWGWNGTRDDVARVVKPGVDDPSIDFIQRGKPDKNVMPYEMADFVAEETELNAVVRSGGEIELIKQLLLQGFPVMIEKGYYERDYTGKVAWLGHYLFVTGYDESQGGFIVQDAWLEPGNDILSTYEEFEIGWRSFNYLFMIVYPPDREAEVFEILGPWGDPTWANQHALDIANQDIQTQSGIDEFFAWFNKGTSHVGLLQYADAAFAYDYAFLLYSQLGDDDTQRPYRIMWYQTGPYWAYYYSGRYGDVISLANTTLNETIAEPTLEESLYWRGQAYLAIGQTGDAVADFRQTVYLNPNFTPGHAILNQLGVTP